MVYRDVSLFSISGRRRPVLARFGLFILPCTGSVSGVRSWSPWRLLIVAVASSGILLGCVGVVFAFAFTFGTVAGHWSSVPGGFVPDSLAPIPGVFFDFS